MKFIDLCINKNINFKKSYFFILAVTAIVCSRIIFVFINDPEGPNFLVVFGVALIIYFLSLAFYIFNPLIKNTTDYLFKLPMFKKIMLLFILVIITIVFMIPKDEDLIRGRIINIDRIEVGASKTPFQSLFQSIGIPFVIKSNSYDLKIGVKKNDKAIESYYIIAFKKDDPILPFLEKVMGSSTPKIADDNPGFYFTDSKEYIFRNIPTKVTFIDNYGAVMVCRQPTTLQENCLDYLSKNLKIKGEPNINIRSLILQSVIAIFFYISIINNVIEFFKRK